MVDKAAETAEPPGGEAAHPPSASTEGPGPDRLNEIGVLRRREIEARMIAPFVEELTRHFDRPQVLDILRKVVIDVARSQGTDLAEQMGGCSPSHLADSLDAWKKDNALELEILN